MSRWLCLGWLLLFCTMSTRAATIAVAPLDKVTSGSLVARLTLDGPIGPAAAEYFDNASKQAAADGAVAIVLILDTPGGLSDATRKIIAGMLASKLPVLVYVAPDGARAASAGTYILYAAQIAAMAPATHLGAATPVKLGDLTPMPKADSTPAVTGSVASAPSTAADDAESHKVVNDPMAYIRSLTQLRGRNASWAEQAVRGAATLTGGEAAHQHVIDFVATDVSDVLAKADGRVVSVGDRSVTLHLAGATVRDYAPGVRTRFLATITNPTMAYLLLLAGIFGLLLEVLHPGAFLPGIVGGICLLTALYALQLLPVNYAGLALIALGVGLLIAEAVNPNVVALGAGGLVSFVVGSVMLMNTGVTGYTVNPGVIGGIAACAAILLGITVSLVWRAQGARQMTGDADMSGDIGTVLQPLDANADGWMMVRGERWRVRCAVALSAGAQVRIQRRDGLLLWVAPL